MPVVIIEGKIPLYGYPDPDILFYLFTQLANGDDDDIEMPE